LVDCGVLYIAFGESYVSEAIASICSLRQQSPNITVAVVTDSRWNHKVQPDLYVIRDSVQNFSCKPRYIYEASPFKKTLFLDTDTYVSRDITAYYELLDWYDIGVMFVGPQLNEEGITLHTQCNSGVILFKKSEQMKDVFHKWQELYFAAEKLNSVEDRRGLGDQRYLSIAIAKSRVRPVHFDTYMHYVLFTTTVTYSPPFIYAGRLDGIAAISEEIKENWDTSIDWHPRLWLPNIKGILPAGLRRSDPILATALLLRRLYNELRIRLSVTIIKNKYRSLE